MILSSTLITALSIFNPEIKKLFGLVNICKLKEKISLVIIKYLIMIKVDSFLRTR